MFLFMITVIIINSNDRIRLGIKYPIRGYANEFPSIDMSIMQLTRTNTRNRKQPKIKDTIEFKRFIKHPPRKIGYFSPSQYKASNAPGATRLFSSSDKPCRMRSVNVHTSRKVASSGASNAAAKPTLFGVNP